MGSILLPALVAGLVFVAILVLLLKYLSSDAAQRKEALVGKMSEDARQNSVLRDADNIKLLKETREPFLFSTLPGIKSTYELLIKTGMWEKRGIFFLATILIFAVVLFVFHTLGFPALLIALLVAYFLPNQYLKHRVTKRNAKFLLMFPEAVDMIVRSVRSGHPLNTAMRMITENMENPIREEFKQVIDEVTYGRTLPEALKRMAFRIGEQDVNFFVVVLSVQQETGGSLTEVLSNLSNIIRKRRQLRAKIRALTSEGRATAYILGAIPVIEFCLLYYTTPSYMEPFFNTLNGNYMLAAAAGLIIGSQFVIRAMIDIDI